MENKSKVEVIKNENGENNVLRPVDILNEIENEEKSEITYIMDGIYKDMTEVLDAANKMRKMQKETAKKIHRIAIGLSVTSLAIVLTVLFTLTAIADNVVLSSIVLVVLCLVTSYLTVSANELDRWDCDE